MPDGRTHQKAHLIGLAPVIVAGAGLSLVYPVIGLCTITGYIAGRLIEPDLDQISITRSEGDAMRGAGCLGVAWVMYWFPYAYALSHRHWLSHFPGVSTILRMIYLLAIPVALVVFYDQPLPSWLIDVAFGHWLGLSLSDTIHYLLDLFS